MWNLNLKKKKKILSYPSSEISSRLDKHPFGRSTLFRTFGVPRSKDLEVRVEGY